MLVPSYSTRTPKGMCFSALGGSGEAAGGGTIFAVGGGIIIGAGVGTIIGASGETNIFTGGGIITASGGTIFIRGRQKAEDPRTSLAGNQYQPLPHRCWWIEWVQFSVMEGLTDTKGDVIW